MKMEPQPLCFAPVYKSYLWGGKRMPDRYNRPGAPEVCAESWEISGHSEGMSVAAGGAYAGETLGALNRRFGAQLAGREFEKFPLIFKILNARERLSVQVHPSDASAKRWGGEAKSEAWYMLGAGKLYAGVRGDTSKPGLRAALTTRIAIHLQQLHNPGHDAGTLRHDLHTALATRAAEKYLLHHGLREGDALYIPGGLIHAVDAGCLVYEIQQCSDTTYRLYDWERNRRLHIDEGLRVVDWGLVPPINRAPETRAKGWRDVIRCDYFNLRELTLDAPETVATDGSFHALFVKDGAARVEAGGVAIEAPCGASVLLPACCGAYTVVPAGCAAVLVTTL